MRRFFYGVALVGIGLVSLVVCIVTEPILAVMRTDRRARTEFDGIGDMDFDSDDPGVDIDEPERPFGCSSDCRAPGCGGGCSQ